MFQEIDKYIAGSIMMFAFMQLVLSKFGWTEIRVMLGTLGLLSIGMGYVSGMGICSLIGIFYGPVHSALPFLLMGLGMDDMFVMMACFRQIQSQSPQKPLEERIASMLRIAGASITITSVTDIVAFIVGGLAVSVISLRIKLTSNFDSCLSCDNTGYANPTIILFICRNKYLNDVSVRDHIFCGRLYA